MTDQEKLQRVEVTLQEWLSPLKRFQKRAVERLQREGRILFRVYTRTNCYSIHATPGYLGAQVMVRKPRAGETWTRGRDLADGDFSKHTWIDILADIVAFELQEVHEAPTHHVDLPSPNQSPDAG